ncbi:hypothetical protein FRC02_007955 [Tulasnella sp. 418]|nr:hypothetical protein FRC02_007955 [Tulasnella sp. 418]
MSSFDVRLPSIIGGLPTSFDVRPTIVMISLYALLLPLCVLRMVQPSSRNVVQLAISAQIVERIINLTVRLLQSLQYKGWEKERTLLLEYQQITLGWGWIALAQSLAPFLRSIMVNATRRPADRRSFNGQSQLPQSHQQVDQKTVRIRVRRVFYFVDLLYWVANLLGLGAYVVWRHAFETKEGSLRKTMDALRYSSTILGIVLVLFNADYALWARRKMRRIDTSACLYLACLWLFLLVIPIYRLTQFQITSVISDPPDFDRILNPLPISSPDGDLFVPGTDASAFNFPTSTTKSKILFYIFHLTPEWIACAIIIATNTRRKFGTGAWGDRDFTWRAGWAVSRAIGWGHGRPWMKDPTDVKMVEVKRFSYEGSANFGEEKQTEKEKWSMMKDSKKKNFFDNGYDSDEEDEPRKAPKHDFEISNEALTLNYPSPPPSIHGNSSPPSPSFLIPSPFSTQMLFRSRPSDDNPSSPVTRLELPLTNLSQPEPALVDRQPRAFGWFRRH